MATNPSTISKLRVTYCASAGMIGTSILLTSFIKGLYSHPAQVVLVATALCMWTLLLTFVSNFLSAWPARLFTVLLCSNSILVCVIALSDAQKGWAIGIVMLTSSLVVVLSAIEDDFKQSISCLAFIIVALGVGLITSHAHFEPLLIVTSVALLAYIYFLIRTNYIPVSRALTDALERAEIFSTITKSSREFHTRETEEAIRNIVNVTKTLGYIAVSIVSFDRRQKIFEDGVPIPNIMDIAVRAAATRRVTITRDEVSANPRLRDGDIVGVPIWINGRYSAALIVQTVSNVRVTQKDCEALELLADQAGRALENAGKAMMDRRVVERLTDESQRDKLTGLGNRRFADAMVANLKPGDVLAMIDLDGLKNTNDVYGHSSGDSLLSAVGAFLTEQIRDPDTAARLGGDEFMIVLHSAGENAQQILERLRALWQDRKLFDTTFSIGMAIHNAHRTPKETVEAADLALYEAKRAGKNRLIASSNPT